MEGFILGSFAIAAMAAAFSLYVYFSTKKNKETHT
jgi:hypothetical protein